MGRVLISTIFEGVVVPEAIRRFGPDRIYLVAFDKKDPKKESVVKAAIKSLKDNFKFIKIERLKCPGYDVPEIVKAVAETIEKEKGNEIVLHITEGRKTQAISIMLAGFLKRDKIKGIYYIEQEKGGLVTLPLLKFGVSKTKKKILQELASGNSNIKSIIKKTGKSKTLVYSNIKDLEQEGYITKDKKLTDSGRIMVL